jgi:hypothetical protein
VASKPAASAAAIRTRNFIGFPPSWAALFGRFIDLRQKIAARTSEVRFRLPRPPHCGKPDSCRRRQESINHAGKKSNAVARYRANETWGGGRYRRITDKAALEIANGPDPRERDRGRSYVDWCPIVRPTPTAAIMPNEVDRLLMQSLTCRSYDGRSGT